MLHSDENGGQYGASNEDDSGRIKLALLDESTSNISLDVEDLFYSECIKRGITFISVAHRESIRKYHQYNLELGLEDQGWRMTVIESCDL